MNCGCEERKEIMFTKGRFDLYCLAVLLCFPLVMFIAGRIAQ